MDTSLNIQPATPEIVWAMLRELAERQAETDRQIKETDRLMKERHAETDRQIKETDRLMKETALQMKETDRKIKETSQQLGSMTNNQGRFAEEYFINSFEKGQRNFFGEKFDSIWKNEKAGMKAVIKDEYDILLINGETVGIVEIKYKAHENDIPEVLTKANTFRANYPDYKNHKVYLGLASMAFYPEVEQTCQKNGIAIIKQAGETVVINDEHLIAY